MVDTGIEAKVFEMPMHRRVAYRVAKEFIAAVVAAGIRDARLRDQAVRAAQSSCLNIAEVASGEAWEEEA